MATRIPVVDQPDAQSTIKRGTWTGLLNGDVGDIFQFPDWADRCIQVAGTFGAGGTVLIEGSNNGVDWATLNDTNGVALSLTAAGLRQMSEAPLLIRPRVSAGDGTTSIAATVICRRLYQFL